jgi:hypothetical protein
VDFGTICGEVAPVHGHAKPSEAGESASAGHVVEAGAGVEMMAAAGASSNGGSLTAVAAGKDVVAVTDDQVRAHKARRRVI